MTDRVKLSLKLNKPNDRIKCKTISLKKYLPKTKSSNDYRYIHYRDPSFQASFNGVVLRKDYQISNLLLKRLRDKSTPSMLKKSSSTKFYLPNQLFISNRDKRLSMSSSRFVNPFRANPDESFYSKKFDQDWTIRGNSQQLSILPSIKKDNQFFVNQYNINSSLPFIPKLLYNGNGNISEGLIHNEFLISKFSFFSKY